MKALVFGLLLLLSMGAQAKDLFYAEGESGRLILTSDDCDLPSIVNLSGKMRWEFPDGKVMAGCWAIDPTLGVVLMYFENKHMAWGWGQDFRTVGEPI